MLLKSRIFKKEIDTLKVKRKNKPKKKKISDSTPNTFAKLI